jgi:hypothetical protein
MAASTIRATLRPIAGQCRVRYAVFRSGLATSRGTNLGRTHPFSAVPSRRNWPCRVRTINNARPQCTHPALAQRGGLPQVIHCMRWPCSATRCAAACASSKLRNVAPLGTIPDTTAIVSSFLTPTRWVCAGAYE